MPCVMGVRRENLHLRRGRDRRLCRREARGEGRGGGEPRRARRRISRRCARNGLTLKETGRETNVRVTATDNPAELGPQDYVILALKAHSVPGVLDSLKPLLGPDTAVVTAQNGVPWWYFYKHGGAHEGPPHRGGRSGRKNLGRDRPGARHRLRRLSGGRDRGAGRDPPCRGRPLRRSASRPARRASACWRCRAGAGRGRPARAGAPATSATRSGSSSGATSPSTRSRR